MFYECVLIVRPDVSVKHLVEVARGIQQVVEGCGGTLEASEYWGFRTLAYRIEKRAKAHYLCLGLSLPSMDPLYHHLKFHQDLLRSMCIKKPKGLQFPTPLFYSSLSDLGKDEESSLPGEEQ